MDVEAHRQRNGITRTLFNTDLSHLRAPVQGPDAYRCVPVFLRLPELWRIIEAQTGRLLRVLLIRRCKVPTDPARQTLLRLTLH